MIRKSLFFASFVITSFNLCAQQTVGMLQHETGDQDSGYILFAPIGSTTTYLINKCGKQVHTWNSAYRPQLSVYLLADGNLLRTGNIGNPNFMGGGVIQKIDWDGNLLFSYNISSATECQHHDIKQLPNGNILAIVWEKKTSQEALAAGRNPNFLGTELWPEKIIEIKPVDQFTYNVVWEWHAWDHLVQRYDSLKPNYGLPKDHPELINLNFVRNLQPDMFHFNSIDYNPDLDQILISVHTFDEIWVIDHSTTSAGAASHSGGKSGKGGDILYRWGNPLAYNNGTTADQKLFKQHDARWIESGYRYEESIMVFNNGNGRPGGINYSSVDIITPPVNSSGLYNSTLPYAPLNQSWIYSDSIPANFYAQNVSGAQQLKNGDVLICDGPKGTFFEIDSNSNKLWKYVSPVSSSGPVEQGTALPIQNDVFKCIFYPSDFKGFIGHKLIPTVPVELNPVPYVCHLEKPNDINVLQKQDNPIIFQNPGNINIIASFKSYEVIIVNLYGQQIYSGQNVHHIITSDFENGFYLVLIKSTMSDMFSQKVIIEK